MYLLADSTIRLGLLNMLDRIGRTPSCSFIRFGRFACILYCLQSVVRYRPPPPLPRPSRRAYRSWSEQRIPSISFRVHFTRWKSSLGVSSSLPFRLPSFLVGWASAMQARKMCKRISESFKLRSWDSFIITFRQSRSLQWDPTVSNDVGFMILTQLFLTGVFSSLLAKEYVEARLPLLTSCW